MNEQDIKNLYDRAVYALPYGDRWIAIEGLKKALDSARARIAELEAELAAAKEQNKQLEAEKILILETICNSEPQFRIERKEQE